MENDKKPLNAFLYLVIIAVSIVWGLSFLFTKNALDSLNTLEVLKTRWTIGAVVIGLLALTGAIKVSYKGKPVHRLMIMAFMQPCIYSICECEGIDRTTTSESAIIIAMVPLFTMLMSMVFLKKNITKKSIFGICLAFLGIMCMIVFSPAFSIGGKLSGYLILLLAVTMGAGYTVYCNNSCKMFSSMEITLVMALEGAVWFNILSLIKGDGFSAYALTFTDTSILGPILFLGLGCTAFCYVGYNLSITRLPAHQASTLQTNLLAVVGVLSGIVFKGDPFGWYVIFGLVLAVAGIVIMNKEEANMANSKQSNT